MGVVEIKTFQDLTMVGLDEQKRMEFVKAAITDFSGSEEYRAMQEAEQYARGLNPTIMKYQKVLYKLSGEAVPDKWAANHKCASGFFKRFVTQEAAYLLGNGISFEDDKDGKTKEKLGKDFDTVLYRGGKSALVQGVSFGFFDNGRVVFFKATEFVPLWDEENGSLKAGIRWWRLDDQHPLRATLYEMDGYTEYVEGEEKQLTVKQEKRAYKIVTSTSEVGGEEIIDRQNYPGFPIVPLWGNMEHASELQGKQGQIDCYDLIKSGFANDLDDASQIYWLLKNTGGMDDADLAMFAQRIKTTRVASVSSDGSDGSSAEAHTIEVPHAAREAALTRLQNDLYRDFMALDVEKISGASVTATQIMAAYEPLEEKTDEFEMCVFEFMNDILALAGIEPNGYSFKRSQIVNQTETTEMVMSASQYLDAETILKKLPFLSADEVNGVLERLDNEAVKRLTETPGMDDGQGEDEAGAVDEVASGGEAVESAESAIGRTLNGAQTQSLLTVMKNLKEGTLSEGQAVNIISTAIGVSKEKALRIIKGD